MQAAARAVQRETAEEHRTLSRARQQGQKHHINKSPLNNLSGRNLLTHFSGEEIGVYKGLKNCHGSLKLKCFGIRPNLSSARDLNCQILFSLLMGDLGKLY